jgi:hypothetical protein
MKPCYGSCQGGGAGGVERHVIGGFGGVVCFPPPVRGQRAEAVLGLAVGNHQSAPQSD